MRYVYVLRSVKYPKQRYVGITSDLKSRLKAHNKKGPHYSAQFRPWKLETYIGFTDEEKANAFEKYLKQGSGHAFLKRHL